MVLRIFALVALVGIPAYGQDVTIYSTQVGDNEWTDYYSPSISVSAYHHRVRGSIYSYYSDGGMSFTQQVGRFRYINYYPPIVPRYVPQYAPWYMRRYH